MCAREWWQQDDDDDDDDELQLLCLPKKTPHTLAAHGDSLYHLTEMRFNDKQIDRES